MPYIDVPGIPGVRAPRTASFNRILRQGDYTFLARGVVLNASACRDPDNTGDVNVLRSGLLLGKRSSDSLYGASIMGKTGAVVAAAATSITLTTQAAVELTRRVGASGTFKLTGPPAAAGVVQQETVTYSAVNTSTGVVTCTATANGYISGAFVQPTDGSEVPITFIPDGWSINVFDLDGNQINQELSQVPIAGVIDAAQLVNWPSDTSMQAWVEARLNDLSGGQFVMGDVRY